MAQYDLHCFAESGNSYKAALMLELTGCDWQPVAIDFFNGETRTEAYRETVNEMGEAPVLKSGDLSLTQSGVILEFLAKQTGQYGAASDAEHYEILRWLYFDNHKLTSYNATLRFMLYFMKTGETPVTEFFRARADGAMQILDKHLGDHDFIACNRVTIADFSACGYLYFDEELGVNLTDYSNICSWLERIKMLPGWKHPYDLMPRAYKA